MNEIFERVKMLMVREFHADPQLLQPETELTALGVDSLATLEFAFELEEAFGISLESTDLRGTTVQAVVDAVRAAMARVPAAELAT
jgi:acyl carrier protein